MAALRRLLLTALCAGLVAGGIAAVSHLAATVPLILKAEAYEKAPHPGSHEAAEWAPENGVERAAYTIAADLMAAIGFALVLAAGIALGGGVAQWKEGLLWGLAGFATFTLAPGLGLPPELPGSEAGPLAARQLWWLATAAMTGGALALFAFARRWPYLVLAAVLLALPHLYGAPAADGGTVVPGGLIRGFAVAATLTSLLFWLALGLATTFFYRRFSLRSG